MAKKKNRQARRLTIQVLWTALTNGYFQGFLRGRIYQGKLKFLCVPGMNCYSCMGALGSCPIGALQAVIGRKSGWFSFYVVGFLMLVGSLVGRLVCGFLCPFGLIQDLLHKIPVRHKLRRVPKERLLVKLKYVILAVFVILLPLFLTDDVGNGAPYFCKLICPVGTLEGGIPMVIANKAVRATVGFLFAWKNVILIGLLVFSVFLYRPFCKFICPLGAVYSLFNKVSLYHYEVDEKKCIHCGKCASVCQMNVDPVQDANHLECIRCGKCIQNCPVDAITAKFGLRPKEPKAPKQEKTDIS